MQENQNIYPHIEPDIEKWAINQLTLNRSRFIGEIRKATFESIIDKYGGDIKPILEKTIYSEIIRVNRTPWRVDPPKEKQYWKHLKKKLGEPAVQNSVEEQNFILSNILENYCQEVVGAFVPQTYRLSRKILKPFFGLLLNKNSFHKTPKKGQVQEKINSRLKLYGDLEHVRTLAQIGTVVILPTHFSNLDSVLIGYAIDSKVGIPSLSYGAGLNLYNFGPAAYFMNRLGAYRVDRRKKNPIYLEVLKNMSKISIEKGVHSLFFPEGTRSRSGRTDTNLKLGLLSTAVEAQRTLIQQGDDNKVFIVPLILDYHCVLEAKYLIRSYLRKIGKERYGSVQDNSHSKRQIAKFIRKYLFKSSEIVLSFGNPMDVMGNRVDEKGVSFDKNDIQVELKDYFSFQNVVETNHQRESEYTKILSEKVSTAYLDKNVVLSSHILAFSAFQILQKQHQVLDVFELLELPQAEISIEPSLLQKNIVILTEKLKEMEKNGKIRLSEVFTWPVEDLIDHGLNHIGLYHPKKVLMKTKDGMITSQDLELLYYYHNRIDSYHLEKYIVTS